MGHPGPLKSSQSKLVRPASDVVEGIIMGKLAIWAQLESKPGKEKETPRAEGGASTAYSHLEVVTWYQKSSFREMPSSGPRGIPAPEPRVRRTIGFGDLAHRRNAEQGDLQDHLGKVPELIYRVREICSYSGRDRG